MLLKLRGLLMIWDSCELEFVQDVVSGDMQMGQFIGWLYDELIML